MIDPIELRKQVRRVLVAAKAYPVAGHRKFINEGYILSGLARFFPETVRVEDMQFALAWNEARGWAERGYDADEERDEWALSEAGRDKEMPPPETRQHGKGRS